MAGIFHGRKEYTVFFASAIENTENLLVPMICIYEVFKKTFQEQGQGQQKCGSLIYIKAKFLI
jgi:hypothetical protein